jgi:hypothetical protein
LETCRRARSSIDAAKPITIAMLTTQFTGGPPRSYAHDPVRAAPIWPFYRQIR